MLGIEMMEGLQRLVLRSSGVWQREAVAEVECGEGPQERGDQGTEGPVLEEVFICLIKS